MFKVCFHSRCLYVSHVCTTILTSNNLWDLLQHKGIVNLVVNSCSSQKIQQGFRDSQGSFGDWKSLAHGACQRQMAMAKTLVPAVQMGCSTWATAAKVKAPDFSTCCKRGALRFERFFLEMEDDAKSLLKIKEGWKEDAEHVSEFTSTFREIQSIGKRILSFCNSWNQIKTPRCRQCKSDT